MIRKIERRETLRLQKVTFAGRNTTTHKHCAMEDRIKISIADSIAVKNQILADQTILSGIETAAEMIVESLKGGGKIHFCGNGEAPPMPSTWPPNSPDASISTARR